MKVAAIVQSYGEVEYLPAVLRSLKDIQVVCVMNCKFRATEDCVDKTLERVQGFKNVAIMQEYAPNQEDSYNRGLYHLKGYDRVLIIDSDEIILKPDLDKLLKIAAKNDCVSAKIIDYSSKSLTKIYEPRTHHPVVIVNPAHTQFINCRCPKDGSYKTDDVTVHHLGYVVDDLNWKLRWGNKVDRGAAEKIICSKQYTITPPKELLEIVFDRR